ncbi:ThuA domain-containing protein [Lignipirellula cremea]|uniref:Trehalose utilization n=1 Tax=Lignipirellula cremea TaxID=2528010 RepID=A0A518E4U6_9BACT|nr:ThuA domain-containing protein [Lignipirellula cremea]QDU99109.1 Trehalose utilization [Lignipirellula cremea]
MITRFPILAAGLLLAFASVSSAAAPHPNGVVWEGDKGPGVGKHIVFIAGDHEYRGEETLPALARILAKHYGFKCSFFVTTDPKDGTINPGSNHITGLEALKTADLMVVFTRFQAFDDEQMQHIDDYLATGKPVIGLRTSTHGFKKLQGEFARYNDGYKGDDKAWENGFGEAILGEHWVGHYGRNHQQSSRLQLQADQADHPILRGVKDVHTQCGGYNAHPREGSVVLAKGEILNGMKIDDPADPSKEILPVAWVRQYKSDNPQSRVFATTHGASEDILNEGFRRMLVNAHLWCLGLEDAIKPDNDVSFVGPYNPLTFKFGGHRQGVKPSDLEGYDSPILGK